LLPLSVAMLVFALVGPRMAARRSPRTVAQLGLLAVSIGSIVMLATLDVKLHDAGFKLALALIGAGAGLLASQLGNVLMSSVEAGLPPDQAHAVAADYGDAQLEALRLSLGAVALAALLSLWFTRRLPTHALAETTLAAPSRLPSPR